VNPTQPNPLPVSGALRVADYNRRQHAHWLHDCARAPLDKQPQLASYIFVNQSTGDPRTTGHVAWNGPTAVLAKTRTKALGELKKAQLQYVATLAAARA
jgi:hypothetical protein